MYIIFIAFFLLLIINRNKKTEIKKNHCQFLFFFFDIYIFINIYKYLLIYYSEFCQYEFFLNINWSYQINLGSGELNFMIDGISLYFIALSLSLIMVSNSIVRFSEGLLYESCI